MNSKCMLMIFGICCQNSFGNIDAELCEGAAGATHNVVFVYPRLSSGALSLLQRPSFLSILRNDVRN